MFYQNLFIKNQNNTFLYQLPEARGMSQLTRVETQEKLQMLSERHNLLEARITELVCKKFLNNTETLEVKTLKKQKLFTKDAITLLKSKNL